MATQALGGVRTHYQDSIEKEVEFVVDHAEARSPSSRTRSRSTSFST